MIASKEIKILVTGFGPFPGHRSNPSGKLILWIEEQQIRFSPNVHLRTALVPTSWPAVEKFAREDLADFDPDIALHFGVHSRAAGMCIEKLARNCTSTHADALGQTAPHHCVKTGAPQTLKSTIEAQTLVTRLRARGLPAQTSSNAGRYLCNALLFASLYQGEKCASPRQTGFIHIPPLNVRGMNKEALLKGAEITISHCVARHIRKSLMNVKTCG